MTEILSDKRLTREQKRIFYRGLIVLGIPLALQQFLNSMINMLDTFMLGSVSEEVLTAASLANKLFFVFIIIIYGVTTGASIFMAQFYGKKDNDSVQKYLGVAMSITVIFSLAFMSAALIIPSSIMKIYTKDPAVIEYGVQYLRIVVFSYLPTAVSLCLYSGLKSTKRPYIPMIFTFASFLMNFIFNYLFIFVLDMGIKGAAYATVIARVGEVAGVIITLIIKKTPISASLRKYFSFTSKEIKEYLKVAGFVIIVEIEWSVGNALYALAYKEYGTTTQAAVQVADTTAMMFNVLAFALGNAAAVIIGNTIGEGNTALAIKYSKKLWLLSIIFGAVIGVAVAALSPALPMIFTKLTPAGKESASICLLIMGAVMPVRCLEFMLMVGILRSGGDTKFCILLDTIGVWVLTLPLMLVATYVFHLPFYVVFIFMNTEMLFKAITGSVRLYRSNNKWLHDVT